MKTDDDLTREIRALEKKIQTLEEISISPSGLDNSLIANDKGSYSIPLIMKQINIVQTLVDHIEIEIDKLEMRVSAIEHMGFRLRTSGR